jgi:hypothetical protein
VAEDPIAKANVKTLGSSSVVTQLVLVAVH